MKAADHRAVRAQATKPFMALKKDHGGAVLERWRDLSWSKCCERAVKIAPEHPMFRGCVCAWLEHCPAHGLTHVGTHD